MSAVGRSRERGRYRDRGQLKQPILWRVTSAHLDDGNDRAILVQGDEGPAQVVRLGHQGTPSVRCSHDGAISSPPAPYHLSVPREDEPRKGAWDLSQRRIAKPRTTTDPLVEERGFELLGRRPPGAPFCGAWGRRSGRLGLARPSNNHADIARSTGYSAPLCPVNLRMTSAPSITTIAHSRCRGTEGSNPPLSSGESIANLTCGRSMLGHRRTPLGIRPVITDDG
jgi:hypothetical protein